MHSPLLFPLLSGLGAWLGRIGWPRGVAALPPARLRSQMYALTYLVRARSWLAWARQPGWPQVHRAWAQAEPQPAVRDALAGRLDERDRVDLIERGADGFERRHALVAQARHTVDIATFYLQADDTGWGLARQLIERARAGVRVRVLADRYAMTLRDHEVGGLAALTSTLAAAGIELRLWHDPARPYACQHRKMIVVDGRSALMGGRNIADHYRGEAWRDLDLVIEGPSVAPLSRLFERAWQAPAPGTSARAGPHASAPWADHEPAGLLHDPVLRFMVAAIGAAQATVDLELAYFMNHDSLCGALARAARRGVRVRLITNSAESNDLPYFRWTVHEAARRVMDAGGRVWMRRGAGRTLHTKYLVVDSLWVSFGSHNADAYSSRMCCECNLLVQDAGLASRLLDSFEQGLQEATPLESPELQRELRRARALRLADPLLRDFQ